MTFACIEYTTKTRRIWRPTTARPNYLCDPDKEIDPTSFGCYTTALDGEHIPLTGLIYDSATHPPSKIRRLRQDLFRRRHGAFGPYSLAYLKKFDVLLVIYQISNSHELVRFVERTREEFPDTILVSCSSPPFGRLREHWKDHPETAERYRAFLAATHVNMNVCRATVPFYRAFSPTPSLYLPQPYPVEYALSRVQGGDTTAGSGVWSGEAGCPERVERARGHGLSSPAAAGLTRASERSPSEPRWGERGKRGTPASLGPDQDLSRRPIIYVAGDTVRPDIMTGHLIAKVLQERHPELFIRVTKTPEFRLNTALLQGTRYEVVPFRPWAEQLRELAGVRLVINTDLWWTRGRVPVDCAAAGIPCVGTTSDGQTELWPELSVPDSTDTDRLIELSERVLTDTEFRTHVVAKAQRRLANYSFARTVERFARAIELASAGRLAEWRDPWWQQDTLVLPTP